MLTFVSASVKASLHTANAKILIPTGMSFFPRRGMAFRGDLRSEGVHSMAIGGAC